MGRSYSSKILLFGEYSIIKNSKALSIPFNLFEGKLAFSTSSQKNSVHNESNSELKAFVLYLNDLKENEQLSDDFDLESFEFDVEQGLIFDSSIPIGYGLGSSAALVAAVYDRYDHHPKKKDSATTERIVELKGLFSKLEAHFHGTSSGVDPLISFFEKPLLIESPQKMSIVEVPQNEDGVGAIFILDTGRPRRTEPLVSLFLEMCKNDYFDKICESELKDFTDNCIHSFLSKNYGECFKNLVDLSNFQKEHFSPMIPKLYHKIWEQGVNTGDYVLKLCGAGGGGVILGFTRDFKQAKKHFKGHKLRVVSYF